MGSTVRFNGLQYGAKLFAKLTLATGARHALTVADRTLKRQDTSSRAETSSQSA